MGSNSSFSQSNLFLANNLVKCNKQNLGNLANSSDNDINNNNNNVDITHFKIKKIQTDSPLLSTKNHMPSTFKKETPTNSLFIDDKRVTHRPTVAIVQPLPHSKHYNTSFQENIFKEDEKPNLPLDLSMKTPREALNNTDEDVTSSDDDPLSITNCASDDEEYEEMWRPW